MFTSRLKSQNANAVNGFIGALKSAADIEDNRANFGF